MRVPAAYFALAALTFTGALSSASATPADDALAELNSISRLVEQSTETLYTARDELVAKQSAQKSAERDHLAALQRVEQTRGELDNYRSAIDRFAAAQYTGGRTGLMTNFLTAEGPGSFIGRVATGKTVSESFAVQMEKYRNAEREAADAENDAASSEQSAKDATVAADAAYGRIHQQQARLRSKMSQVKAKYAALTQEQRAALAPESIPAPEDATDEVVAPILAPPLPPPTLLTAMVNDIPAPAAVIDTPTLAESSASSRALKAAMTQIGTPYVWGGAAPGGFDCSGLVMWSFRQAGVSLPHSSQSLARGGAPVSSSDMQPGDVVTYYGDASHVGIYVGDGQVIHAPTYGQTVRVVPLSSSGPVHNVRRY